APSGLVGAGDAAEPLGPQLPLEPVEVGVQVSLANRRLRHRITSTNAAAGAACAAGDVVPDGATSVPSDSPPKCPGGQILMNAFPITLSIGICPRSNRESFEFDRLSPRTNRCPGSTFTGGSVRRSFRRG